MYLFKIFKKNYIFQVVFFIKYRNSLFSKAKLYKILQRYLNLASQVINIEKSY